MPNAPKNIIEYYVRWQTNGFLCVSLHGSSEY